MASEIRPIDRRLAEFRYAAANFRLVTNLIRLRLLLKAGFRPDQPRVPAGNGDRSGRWRDESANVVLASGRRSPMGNVVRINGISFEATPAQVARLEIAAAQMRNAVAAVRQYQPNWKPTPQLVSTIEGQIAGYQAAAREAQARSLVLQSQGLGVGRYAVESVPSLGPGRNLRTWQRAEGNRIGNLYGCHTCGAKTPGTVNSSWILDHQPSRAYHPSIRRQALYPHCLSCSLRQGGYVSNYLRNP